MKIIDAHVHTNFGYEQFLAYAKSNNMQFSWNSLQNEMNQNNVAGALIITTDHEQPTPGESKLLLKQRSRDKRLFPVCSIHPDRTSEKDLALLAKLFQERKIYGLKIFPGYHPVYPSDKRYHPFYELAGKYKIPVIIHTGDTCGSEYFVKFSHPLDVDEIAVKFGEATFVLAHLGNPWVRDAAELVYKNENVYADLSSFCIGHPNTADMKRIVEDIQFALNYTDRPDKFLYGSDWPLSQMADYIEVIKKAVHVKHHKAIFFGNANRVFKLGL